jgi:hypothetical protein
MARSFTFQAGARPVISSKFKDETQDSRICYHITVDPRVARGSVYSHHKVPKNTIKPIRYHQRAIPQPKEEVHEHVEEEEVVEEKEFRPDLLDIDDRPIEEDLATAKETYIEKAPTPHFVPDEPGVDVETQVWHGDLFDYDAEVRPLIKIIVQHTLLRALAEVHEELEIENINKHRDRYEHERNVILAELQRLEAKEQRKFDEDKRRRQQREAAEKEISEKKHKAAADGFGESFAVNVMMGAMDVVEHRGDLFDEVLAEVEDKFLPWTSAELEIAMGVKDMLFDLKRGALLRAIDVREERVQKFQVAVEGRRAQKADAKAALLRGMFVEDRGAASIRQARKDHRERKEREAAEAAAREEAQASEAAEDAERVEAEETVQASADETPESADDPPKGEDAESYSDQ